MRSWARLSIIAALVILAAALHLARPGYSVDEEFTVFAVRGIAAHGLPVFPSGMLYDRGLAYSYGSWLVGLLPGPDLPSYRALSLAAAVGALVMIYLLMRDAFSEGVATMAVGLAVTSIPFWVAATTARFYAPFLAAYVLSIYALRKRRWLWLLLASMLCRWTHELAFTLIAIPAVGLLLSKRDQRRRWLEACLAVSVGLAVAQIALFGLHYLAPASGGTMIRRFFMWQVVNLFERPPDRQFGLALVVMLIGWLIAPHRWRLILVVSLCAVALILGMSTARALQLAPLSAVAVRSILFDGSRYPLDMFWSLALVTPTTVAVALALILARLSGWGGEWPLSERAFHLAWIGWVLWFGVIESGITVNYQLLPVTAMLLAITVDWHAVSSSGNTGTQATRLAFVLLFGGIAIDQTRDYSAVLEGLEASRPTISIPGMVSIREGLQPADRVACTDELACLMLVGRVDAWLALNDYVRERFLVRRAPLHGVPSDDSLVGVYAGAPAVFRPADLFDDLKDGRAPVRVLIVDVFKEYPVGNSRDWLPRAIEIDGLEARTLLESPHARVVQVSRPVRNAGIP